MTGRGSFLSFVNNPHINFSQNDNMRVTCKMDDLYLLDFTELRLNSKGHFFSAYTAVSRKVVQKKHKSVRDNAERHYGKLSV